MPENQVEAWSPDMYRDWKKHCRTLYLGEKNCRAVLRLAGRRLRGRILDVGCGDGATMRWLRECGHAEVFGVDLAPAPGPGVYVGDLRALQFGAAEFDSLRCMDVIEHLPPAELVPALTELRRVLKPGGHLFATTPNREDIEAALVFCPTCRKRFHSYGHTRTFSAESLAAEFASAGFRSVRVQAYGPDAYFHFGRLGGAVSRLGRILFPRMRWDEMLFADAVA
jgi:SAM-dependent methyltransferase